MFRDAQEELERLQAQLLEEAEQEQVASEEEFLDEEVLEALLSDTDQGENPEVYQNYSNNYGRNLRNYATGYRAYNTDKTDVLPDDLSQEVLGTRKKAPILLWILLGLMAVLLGMILWNYLTVGGLF